MTAEQDPGFVVVDTMVLSWFTKRHRTGEIYSALLGEQKVALSYFARTELEGYEWGERRQERLRALIAGCVELPVSDATGIWYNRGKLKRRDLQLVSRVQDNDLWIIAHAAEHRLPYMSHDAGAVAVAHAIGLTTLTALPDDTWQPLIPSS